MNQPDSESKVEETKTEEALQQLLEKLEKNIVGGIKRSIEIADNFSRESTSSQAEAEIVQTNKTEAVKNSIVPSFVLADFEKQKWEFLNPIALYRDNWLGATTGGISLDRGIYKIDYKVTAIASKGTGLAVFNKETKKFEKLLFWQIGTETSEQIINVSGTQHLAINSPSIINITDAHGNFNPKDIESVYIVTVFRVRALPE